MIPISFDEAMKKINPERDILIISPGKKTENRGLFTIDRVDKKTVPEGWYAYDIRHGDSGNPTCIEPSVFVNHYGTFLTQTPVKFNKDGYRSLRVGGGYSFS